MRRSVMVRLNASKYKGKRQADSDISAHILTFGIRFVAFPMLSADFAGKSM
jgi:hypothetical protein